MMSESENLYSLEKDQYIYILNIERCCNYIKWLTRLSIYFGGKKQTSS